MFHRSASVEDAYALISQHSKTLCDLRQRIFQLEQELRSQQPNPDELERVGAYLSAADMMIEDIEHDINALNAIQDSLMDQYRQQDENERTVLVFGKTRSGKSALGNLILGSPVFLESDSMAAVTRENELVEAQLDGLTIRWIDTIGLNDTELSDVEVFGRILKTMVEMRGKFNLIVCCVNAQEGMVNDDFNRILTFVVNMIGAEALDATMIAFTKCDNIPLNSRKQWLRNVQRKYPAFNCLLNGTDDNFVMITPGIGADPVLRDESREVVMKAIREHRLSVQTESVRTHLHNLADALIQMADESIQRLQSYCDTTNVIIHSAGNRRREAMQEAEARHRDHQRAQTTSWFQRGAALVSAAAPYIIPAIGGCSVQ